MYVWYLCTMLPYRTRGEGDPIGEKGHDEENVWQALADGGGSRRGGYLGGLGQGSDKGGGGGGGWLAASVQVGGVGGGKEMAVDWAHTQEGGGEENGTAATRTQGGAAGGGYGTAGPRGDGIGSSGSF